MKKIKKLPQDLINQISAGEVIENPASVVKELIDNSLDAGATEIGIRLTDGGVKLIEITDNGSGIPEDSIEDAFEPHATSKIETMADLAKVMTMGFRGEALSTIKSVAKVIVISKPSSSDYAYEAKFTEDGSIDIKKAARDQGTTIKVEELFYNVPARLKFMKSPETEYRKVVETLIPYLLINPHIHFYLENNGRPVYNLPAVPQSVPSTIHPARVREVLKKDFADEMIDLFYSGDGINVGGLIGHPNSHASKVKHQYVYINNRPIWDNGLARAVTQGYFRFIPEGQRVPFILKTDLKPELVDVNVHPRKEEVRFYNPYRVYTAVEQAVQAALKEKIKSTSSFKDVASESSYDRLRQTSSPIVENYDLFSPSPSSTPSTPTLSSKRSRDIDFRTPKSDFSVANSLEFSKNILESSSSFNDSSDLDYDLPKADNSVNDPDVRSVSQIFNKYILVEFREEVWFVDQHAAAERVTFERLMSRESASDKIQHLLVPTGLNLSPDEYAFIDENKDFFIDLGFELDFESSENILVKSVPAEFVSADLGEVFQEIFSLASDQRDLSNNYERAKGDIIATMACHTSIRTGQRLDPQECLSLVRQLMACENPYSCPHGRPAVWKMTLSDIDKNFERTY